MKVVILAAGKGSRLGLNEPKCLTLLNNGKTILSYQIELLLKHVTITDIIVVVGFQKEKILKRFPDLSYVCNPHFATTNTAKSLLLAIKGLSCDVLWLNGDVIFKAEVLRQIFAQPKTGMVVNIGPVGDEEVKYRQDQTGRILEVSKQVKDPLGEALGINYCTAANLPLLQKGLEKCSDTDYFERGIEYCIEAGMPVWSIPVESGMCVEIDYPEDLVRANAMLSINH